MALWQLGEKERARTTLRRADDELRGYEQRWKEQLKRGIGAHPSPDMLRRIRDEAKALIDSSPQAGGVTGAAKVPESRAERK